MRDLSRLALPDAVKIRIVEQYESELIIRFPFSARERLRGISYEIVGYQGPIRYVYDLKKNLAVFVGILLFVGFIFINSKSIKKIEFNAETSKSDEIVEIIESHYQRILGLNFLKSDLNTINFALRREFTEFEWIDVRREGTVLKVTILEPNIINKKVVKREGYGDLVARESGLITSFHVRQGIVLVTENQYVEKGQLLVSGNLNYKWPDRPGFYVPAEGNVKARVHRERVVEVLKEQQITAYTGKVKSHSYLNLFGLKIPLKAQGEGFKDYDEIKRTNNVKIFNRELPFGIKKVHYYEKNDIIRLYDENASLLYARSVIYYELSQMFEEGDELVDLLLLQREETEDRYIYHFLLITNENIAEFRRSHADE